MTKLSDRVLAQQEHMDGVRAVHRRSAFERVLNKIEVLHDWERSGWAGKDGFEFDENAREQLAHLIELRDIIRAELIEHGQIPNAPDHFVTPSAPYVGCLIGGKIIWP